MLTFLKSKKDRVDDAGLGFLAPEGKLSLEKITYNTIEGEMDILDIAHYARPHNGLSHEMNMWKIANVDNINRGLVKIIKAKEFEIPTFWGTLWVKKIDGDTGEEFDYGIASLRVVTTVGVGYIVDAFQNSVELENMKFHGLGTGNTAEAIGDTALVTELTTEYSGNVRATGSTTESAANVYRTVGTNTLDSGTPAVVEHGIFSASSTGVLLDRSTFAAINLVGADGDSLQTIYDLTLAAGS
jgi:hypothetical protein